MAQQQIVQLKKEELESIKEDELKITRPQSEQMDEGDSDDYVVDDYSPSNVAQITSPKPLAEDLLNKRKYLIGRGTNLPIRIYFDCEKCMSGKEKMAYDEYQRVKLSTSNWMDFYRPEWTYLAENLLHFQRACIHKQKLAVDSYEKDLTRKRLYVDEDSIDHGFFHPLESLRSFIGFKYAPVEGTCVENLASPE